MGRFRVSLAGISGVFLVAGIVAAALRAPSERWASGAFSLAVLVLAAATLGACCAQGERRGYWGGFAILGWGYMFLCFGPWCDSKVAPLLFTKTLGEYAHDHFGHEAMFQEYTRDIPGTTIHMYGYQQVGHALSALLAGLLGGAVGRWCVRSRVRSAGIEAAAALDPNPQQARAR